ncbi:penicillin-binding transpeptidase domain-containing protein [Embleya sp. NPDC059237]|uniref:penicillin-binding transpeptidase domain-containing protein n=1 Tax=Embleya sp. NPDC059237 TaxID=3346784 RepID=UPI0036B2B55A
MTHGVNAIPGSPGSPGSPGPEPRARRRPRRPRRAWALVVAGALVLGGTGWAAVDRRLGGGDDDRLGPAGARGTASGEADRAARTFLDHWAAGRWAEAARLTDDPPTAETTLRSFTVGLEITEPTFTPGPARAAAGAVTVPFGAAMPVAGLGAWNYDSTLTLAKGDGGWIVKWQPALVHPKLGAEAKFRLAKGAAGAPAAKVLDRNGGVLSPADHPSLTPIFAAGGGAGSGGGSVQLISRATGEVVSTEAEFGATRPAPGGGPVATTIDPRLQRAADAAVAKHANGRLVGLVAVSIDKGEVLALANAPTTGMNRAFMGRYAPGSTMKVITTAALLSKGAVKPSDVVDCPKYLTVGKQFHNVETSEIRGATFREDFKHSCNTAFVSLRGKLGNDELSRFANDHFGIGQEWKTGIASFDGKVPLPVDETDKSAAMFGQGTVQANPLVMASATATAVSGKFRQPVVIKGQRPTAKGRDLPASVVADLRGLMRATVTDGSAKILADLPGDVGAKTGTAEVTETGPNNGWLVAYRGNVAIACLVEGGITGSGSAGPIVHDILSTTT